MADFSNYYELSQKKKKKKKKTEKKSDQELEPVIRMSHENISVVDFDCRYAPNFEFCFDF